jgi:hypothetical protein
MPKQVAQKELDLIVNLVARFPDGVSLGKIIDNLTFPISRRNLRHRLTFLTDKGLLRAEGKARGRLYKTPSNQEKNSPDYFEDPNAHVIPLSPEAKTIQNWVTQPIQKRTPVGYNLQFLDDYRPNVSYYLSESVRQQLFKMGKTEGEQPAGTYARKIRCISP